MRTGKPKPRSKSQPLHHRAARHLHRWLLPHAQNDHRPHLIRLHGLAAIAVLILGLQAAGYAMLSAPTPMVKGGHVLSYAAGSITPTDLLNLTNQDRAAAGLPPLKLDSRLNQSAALKAQNMFDEDYWNHVSPSCIDPWHWFKQVGYAYTFAGENLAKDFDTSTGVNDGWMNSAGHKANILNTHYTDVGFAVVNGTLPELPDGQVTPSCAPAGTQTNGQTTLVVAHYGATAQSVAAATPAATPASSSVKPAVAAASNPTSPSASDTPTATPTATPTPSASASPSHTPVAAISKDSGGTTAPGTKSYSLFAPLSLVKTLNWPTLATLGLLVLLLLVYGFTHLTVWRKGLARWRKMHYKLYAAASVSALAIAIVLLATSGFGKVG